MSLKTIRNLLGILGGASLGYGLVALFLIGPRDFGVAVAISAACVIGVYLVKAIESDRRRAQDYREQVWQRRIDEAHAARPELTIIKGGKEPDLLEQIFPDLKPWPIGDDEVRR